MHNFHQKCNLRSIQSIQEIIKNEIEISLLDEILVKLKLQKKNKWLKLNFIFQSKIQNNWIKLKYR